MTTSTTPHHDLMPDYGQPGTVGIPYASANYDGSVNCPGCGERIQLVEAKDFESYSGSEYAKHFDLAFRVEGIADTIRARWGADAESRASFLSDPGGWLAYIAHADDDEDDDEAAAAAIDLIEKEWKP